MAQGVERRNGAARRPPAREAQIRRYAAYYHGWCQAFGEHEGELVEGREISWLHGEGSVGLIVSPALKKVFMRELLGRHRDGPVLWLDAHRTRLRLNEASIAVEYAADAEGLARLAALLLREAEPVHMYLTHHIYYPPGTRILTFSRTRPVVILYKEIGRLLARVA